MISVQMRVRAHFTYEPTDDKMIPCREAGLNFEKGEILHIVNQDDENWWQARKEGDRNMRAGLIPSRKLQERYVYSFTEYFPFYTVNKPQEQTKMSSI